MKKTIENERTKFNLIELYYKDIIREIQNIPSTDIPKHFGPNVYCQAKRIKFMFESDIPDLKCIEYIDKKTDKIVAYFYDWESSAGAIMKFHNHYHHDEAPEDVKEFDPFHLHIGQDRFDKLAKARKKDEEFKCLQKVLDFIKLHVYEKIREKHLNPK
ncbi:DUF6516 family protein [Gottfriedia acidiceleris]|uniref:toxin-antitoxin system TumE family protein n=1 Tax=Bacillaceae TaxID=186817 RepID=UPI000BEC5487|nr:MULTISPECIES: DUF6516 family protein [unclassified Bacillus (in: firmicutes)]PEC51455.1 hypothetical protein CON00_02200 [Bacillus sp. AFS096315]PFM78749.1 hypothetical protein COJ46_17050 [Bacillus sp. AFS077874]